MIATNKLENSITSVTADVLIVSVDGPAQDVADRVFKVEPAIPCSSAAGGAGRWSGKDRRTRRVSSTVCTPRPKPRKASWFAKK